MTTTKQSHLCASAQTKMQWNDLTPCQRSAVVGAAVVQVTLLTAAQIDITRRSKEQIRGAKLLWRILVFVNFIGPIAYFAVGRRRSAAEPAEAEEPAAAEEPTAAEEPAAEPAEEAQPEGDAADDPDPA